MPKFLSLRAFDLMRTHHPIDTDAIIAQRAMVDAQARHSRSKKTSVIVGKVATRFKQRHRDIASTLDTEDVIAARDFQEHLCRAIKLDVAALRSALFGELWLSRINGMSASEIADIIRECLPAAIDEWQQENRGGRERRDDNLDPQMIADAVDEAIKQLSVVRGAATAVSPWK